MKKHLLKLQAVVLTVCLGLTSISFAQTTYTFTSAGANGNVGPLQGQCDTEYAGTSLDGNVTATGGIQYWVIPNTGTYTIEAFGGQGYGPFGGRGAHITGEFALTAGETIKILVGQQAGDYLNFPATTYNHQFGGGGGSFVTLANNTPLVVAGGGGGNHTGAYVTGCDGQITQNGADGVTGSIIGAGGTGGLGGLQASSADGGGGFNGDGDGLAGGQAFVNGGLGGIDEGTGGFGGGGGTSSWNNYRGGGGGGYSGGGGANNSGTCCAVGGGGGSFNSGSNPIDLAGVQLGDGQVIITLNCNPTMGSLTADIASLPNITEECVLDSLTAPTASNSCGSALYEGIPDATLPITTVGTTTVTWTYDDGVNTITQTQDVVISGVDNTPPIEDVASLPTLAENCGFTPPTPTASDVCDGTINGVADVTFPLTSGGANTVTWTYTDNSGNSATQTQTINITDGGAPQPSVATLAPFDGCNSVTPPTPTAVDACVGTIAGTPDVTFPITTLGTTTVTWTYDDGNGNIVTQTQDISVTAIDTGITANGAQLTADLAAGTYQWIDCANLQPIAGETNQMFEPTTTGEYAVIVSDGSCSDTSACVLVDFTGITEWNKNAIKLYPNPTNTGMFTIDFDGVMDEIQVMDALGRAVEVSVNLSTGEINGSNLEAGRYSVKVIASKTVYSTTLVIIK